MVSVFSKFSLLFVFGFSLFISTSGLAQSRVNTKELSAKLEKSADEHGREARELEKQAQALQRAIEKSKKKSEKFQQELTKIDQEILEMLGRMVGKIMNHKKAGPLIREKPHLIFTIPEIQKITQKEPNLELVIRELVNEYRM